MEHRFGRRKKPEVARIVRRLQDDMVRVREEAATCSGGQGVRALRNTVTSLR